MRQLYARLRRRQAPRLPSLDQSLNQLLSSPRKSLGKSGYCEAPGTPQAGQATKQSHHVGGDCFVAAARLLAVTVTVMVRGEPRIMWIASGVHFAEQDRGGAVARAFGSPARAGHVAFAPRRTYMGSNVGD